MECMAGSLFQGKILAMAQTGVRINPRRRRRNPAEGHHGKTAEVLKIPDPILVLPEGRPVSLEKLNILNDELDGVYHNERANQRAVVFVHGILGDKATTWQLREA